MKINFKIYLMYMFSIVLISSMLQSLSIFFSIYIDGGIKQFDKEYLNETFPFVIVKFEVLNF